MMLLRQWSLSRYCTSPETKNVFLVQVCLLCVFVCQFTMLWWQRPSLLPTPPSSSAWPWRKTQPPPCVSTMTRKTERSSCRLTSQEPSRSSPTDRRADAGTDDAEDMEIVSADISGAVKVITGRPRSWCRDGGYIIMSRDFMGANKHGYCHPAKELRQR